MSDRPPLATIDFPECLAWIEVYPRGALGEPIRAWKGQDEDVCRAQPLQLCPHIHAMIAGHFPGHLSRMARDQG
jgi:hypothetical protein